MILLRMPGKNLFLELNPKMVLANQIAGFLNVNISKTIEGIKLIFFGSIKVSNWWCKWCNFTWDGHAQSMHKEAMEILRSHKLKQV